ERWRVVCVLLRVGRGKRFLPWTASAFALGLGFGWLAVWTTNLGAPIAAHFVINFLNLRYIVAEPAVLFGGSRAAAEGRACFAASCLRWSCWFLRLRCRTRRRRRTSCGSCTRRGSRSPTTACRW